MNGFVACAMLLLLAPGATAWDTGCSVDKHGEITENADECPSTVVDLTTCGAFCAARATELGLLGPPPTPLYCSNEIRSLGATELADYCICDDNITMSCASNTCDNDCLNERLAACS